MLTEEWLQQNCGRRADRVQELTDGQGLGVRVSALGKIVFQMRYRLNGVPRRLDLGTYPTMSLSEARSENERLRKELGRGRDPKLLKQMERQASSPAATIEDLFRSWYEWVGSDWQAGGVEVLRSFETFVFPRVGSVDPRCLRLTEWTRVLLAAAVVSPSLAIELHHTAVQVFDWAVSFKILPANLLANRMAQISHSAGRQPTVAAIAETIACSDVSESESSKQLLTLCLSLVEATQGLSGCRTQSN